MTHLRWRLAQIKRTTVFVLGLAVATLAWGSSAPSQSLLVTVDLASELPVGPASARLLIEQVSAAAGETQTSPEFVREVDVPWHGRLDLDRDRTWRISAEARGYWAQAIVVHSESESVHVALLPTGFLAGRIESPSTELSPRQIEARIETAEAVSSRSHSVPTIPRTTLACPVTDSRWICEVPSGQLDLRIAVENYIPHYFWDAEILPRSTTDLGTLRLEAGASLAGWIAYSEVPAQGSVARVALERRVSGWQTDPEELRRLEARSLTATADKRGFFQVKGIPAGGYALIAESSGFAPARIPDVAVEEKRETFLDAPIVLQRPVSLELFIEPPVDPSGLAWTAVLGQLKPGSAVFETKLESAASIEGAWMGAGLEPGHFLLKIEDALGRTWEERWVAVEPEMGAVFVEIPVVPVEGRVTAGSDPLQAILAFGSTQGAVQIRMTTDDQGYFEGYLPREGLWSIDLVFEDQSLHHQALEPVEVRRRPGRRTAVVDIELPETELTGTVVAEGEPVAGANVALLRYEEDQKRREAILKTDSEGEFELRGLAPGALLVRAYQGKRSTTWQSLELGESRKSEIRLVLRNKVELTGLVLSPSGEVPGAGVAAWAKMADGLMASLEHTLSRFDGSFALQLPDGLVAADLIVTAPGYAHHLARVPMSSGQSPTILSVSSGGGMLVFADEVVESAVAANPHSILFHNGTEVPLDILVRLLFPKSKVGTHAGSLALMDMPPGEYSLCRGPGGPCAAGYLPPGGELMLRATTEAEEPN